jgi:hypothetical protein
MWSLRVSPNKPVLFPTLRNTRLNLLQFAALDLTARLFVLRVLVHVPLIPVYSLVSSNAGPTNIRISSCVLTAMSSML